MARCSLAGIVAAAVLGLAACTGRTERLVEASHRGDVQEVRRLLAAGAAPAAARRDNGWTALHVAAAGGQVEVVRVLLDAGVPVDSPAAVHGMEGAAAIFFAAMYGHVSVIDLLLDRGSNPSQVFEGRTPEEFARAYRQMEAASRLRERQAGIEGDGP